MMVWDVEKDEFVQVTVAEAVAGLLRYARSLGPGTPACAVYERKAMELVRSVQR